MMEFLEEMAFLLSSFSWVHNSKVTNFFVESTWEKLPNEWIKVLENLTNEELNSIPCGMIKNEWPSSLKLFLESAVKNGNRRYDIKTYMVDDSKLQLCKKRISTKKLHEVETMARFVKEQCSQANCQHIVDCGSGLAYLDLALADLGLNIIGLETDAVKVHKVNVKVQALGNQKNRFQSTAFHLSRDQDSIDNLEQLIKRTWHSQATNFHDGDRETDDSPGVCMLGLHCCGDLSPAMIDSFLKISRIKHLMFFGCCYHSMETDGKTFRNFPLSTKLKNLNPCLNRYSMRLAAQQTRAAWVKQTPEKHLRHSLNVSYRAVLELAVAEHNLSFKKSKRKLAQIEEFTSFESYLDEVFDRSTLSGDETKDLIISTYEKHKEFMRLVEPFTMLQVMLQPVIEFLILIDRCEYIREHGYHCELMQLFNDEFSPRNCMIVANK